MITLIGGLIHHLVVFALLVFYLVLPHNYELGILALITCFVSDAFIAVVSIKVGGKSYGGLADGHALVAAILEIFVYLTAINNVLCDTDDPLHFRCWMLFYAFITPIKILLTYKLCTNEWGH